MERSRWAVPAIIAVLGAGYWALTLQAAPPPKPTKSTSPVAFDEVIDRNSKTMLAEGRKIFRYDTFGSEAFWGGKVRLHEAILGQTLGGVGRWR